MRLLHPRDADDRDSASSPSGRPVRARYPRRAEREPVQVHRISRCGSGRARTHYGTRGEGMTTDALPGLGGIRKGESVGARITRFEDPRILMAEARYVADLAAPRMVHAAFARSTHAHARIHGI